MNSSFKPKPKILEFAGYVVLSTLIILFLFYIDEGRYSLKGVSPREILLGLTLYLIPILLSQYLVRKLSSSISSFPLRFLVNGFGGILLGVIVLFTFFMLLKIFL